MCSENQNRTALRAEMAGNSVNVTTQTIAQGNDYSFNTQLTPLPPGILQHSRNIELESVGYLGSQVALHVRQLWANWGLFSGHLSR